VFEKQENKVLIGMLAPVIVLVEAMINPRIININK
jgi:hypothetical protein